MSECVKIDPLVTPYVDGALPAPERADIERHLQKCPPCRARVDAERAVHALIADRRADLQHSCAPQALHARCAMLAAARERRWPVARIARFAVAATLVLAVGVVVLQQLTRNSTRVLAAELAGDHVKCFLLNAVLGTHQTSAEVEQIVAANFAWNVHLPERPEQAGLELVGARPCLYADGTIAHVMYRHDGEPVSLFMLPSTARPAESVGVLGHEAAIWSAGDRTFVLLAHEPRTDVERMASFVRASLR